MDLQSVASALYALPVAEFTAERDAQAANARESGDEELAAAIKRLRRPTAGAALVNLLVRERRDDIDELLEIGSQLRQAQQDLATDDLRQLSQQRRGTVATLVKQAQQFAQERGQPVSAAVLSEVRATLDAASADEAAAAALRDGQLTKALHYSGFGAGIGAATPAPAAERQGRRTPPPQRVEKLDARRILREANEAAQRARDEFTATDHALGEARLRTEDRRRAVLDLEEQLLSAREELARAKRELAAAQHDHTAADRALQQADRAATKARRDADRGKH